VGHPIALNIVSDSQDCTSTKSGFKSAPSLGEMMSGFGADMTVLARRQHWATAFAARSPVSDGPKTKCSISGWKLLTSVQDRGLLMSTTIVSWRSRSFFAISRPTCLTPRSPLLSGCPEK
jgi:hypothetical protein